MKKQQKMPQKLRIINQNLMVNSFFFKRKMGRLPMKNRGFSSENSQKQEFLPLISGVCSHYNKISLQL
jgi:hypothetical protein